MLTDAEIADLKEKNPGAVLRIFQHEDICDGRDFVYKVPRDAAWKMFQTHREQDDQKAYALRTLVVGHMVLPPPAEFVVLLDTAPGLIESIGNKMVKAAGASNAGNDRKL